MGTGIFSGHEVTKEMGQVPIWVISLPRSVERRANVSACMQAAGLDFEFFDAFDGRSLSAPQLSSLYDEKKAILNVGRPLSFGEIGCSLSHLALYEKLLASDAPYALIMEDDIEFSKDILQVLSRTALFPENWDVVHLSWEHGQTSLLNRIRLTSRYKMVRFIFHSWGSYAYLVGRRAAARMLEAGRPVIVPPDHLPQGLKSAGLAIFGIDPVCVMLNQELAFDPKFNTLAADRFKLQDAAGQRSITAMTLKKVSWLAKLRLLKRRLDPKWII